jgi:hypothetical protein
VHEPAADERLGPGAVPPGPDAVTGRAVNRVAVIGCPGSGKTWLARRVARGLALPQVELDDHFWGPGWVPMEEVAWGEQVNALASRTAWVIDGNYEKSLPIRLQRCQWLIWTDLTTLQCLVAVVRRALGWMVAKESELPHYVRAPGGRRRISHGFVGLLWFVLTFRRKVRPRIVALIEALPGPSRGPAVSVVRSRRDARELADLICEKGACAP